jgi:hypothetical protein
MRATSNSYRAFNNHQRIASGALQTVALAAKRIGESKAAGQILVFDDNTGRVIDIDTRGSEQEILARCGEPTVNSEEVQLAVNEPRGRGRPKLGVVSREVTLLPRHWEWLNAQPGGASVALRKLVEEAKRIHTERDKRRKAQERAYNFMSAMAGNMPNYEEALRALFAQDYSRLRELVAPWPEDIRAYALYLAFNNGQADL